MIKPNRSTGYLEPAVEVDDLEFACRIVAGSDAISWNTPLQLEPWLKKRKSQDFTLPSPVDEVGLRICVSATANAVTGS
jgi:hypothetical protein